MRLHPEREFESLNAALEFGIVLPALRAAPVHFLQHVQFISLLLGSKPLVLEVFNRLGEVLDLHSALANGGSLVGGRQKAGTPVLRSTVGERWFYRDESRKVLVLGAQAVHRPRAHARPCEGVRSGM